MYGTLSLMTALITFNRFLATALQRGIPELELSEAISVIVEKTYNGKAAGNEFAGYEMDGLRRRLA